MLEYAAEHDFGIDEILGAAKADHPHLNCHCEGMLLDSQFGVAIRDDFAVLSDLDRLPI